MNKFLQKMKQRDQVANFMGGISYKIDPMDTLRMISASSIFGEPSYYRNGEFGSRAVKDSVYAVHSLFSDYSILDERFVGLKTSHIMEQVIDEALTYDFEAVIDHAVELREKYLMRLTPQVIMVRAAAHQGRGEFTRSYPGKFASANARVMSRGDEPASQLTYWLYKNQTKNKIPGLLKRSWASKLSSLSAYEIYKYKNSGLGIIDTVRICHAASPYIDELMRTGTISADVSSTWESLRSGGDSWQQIIGKIRMPHMALLRNLRGIFLEIDDIVLCRELMEQLKGGVEKGRQFPYRYWTALKNVSKSEVNHKTVIMDALEECVDIASSLLPSLKGRTMCLSDNSGSAWGAFTSEYGSVTVAEIDNLSSIITARNSEEGYIGKFGDRLNVTPVLKKNGILSQCEAVTQSRFSDVGGSTENGIWLFIDQAMKQKEHWDNIFIYSDQQAGHGGLYGTDEGCRAYTEKGYHTGRYVDVARLIGDYRRLVNQKVNVFSVQTAGYDNVCIPEYGYRTNILYGWTGKELQFAKSMIDFWDELEA